MVQWILTAGCGEGRINGFVQSHTNMQQGSTTVSQVVTVVAKKSSTSSSLLALGPAPTTVPSPTPILQTQSAPASHGTPAAQVMAKCMPCIAASQIMWNMGSCLSIPDLPDDVGIPSQECQLLHTSWRQPGA